jgi:hypothetical protein
MPSPQPGLGIHIQRGPAPEEQGEVFQPAGSLSTGVNEVRRAGQLCTSSRP